MLSCLHERQTFPSPIPHHQLSVGLEVPTVTFINAGSGTLEKGSPDELQKMLPLRVKRSELTYEVTITPFLAAVIDTPGRIVSSLLSQLEHMSVDLSDISLDDGPLEDRGLNCDIDKYNASILLRADRFEIRFFAIDEKEDVAAGILRGVWQAMTSVSPEITAKSHSLLFELDCEIAAGSYAAALERFCRPYEGLPKGTETAVAYYLPPDSSQGFLDSSVVLHRSAEVDGGIVLVATLVFEGTRLSQDGVVQAGRKRLNELLRSLDITLKDSR